MTVETKGKDHIIWQEAADNIPGEPAILVMGYNDCITIQQEDRWININYESVDEICRLLKKLKKDQK